MPVPIQEGERRYPPLLIEVPVLRRVRGNQNPQIEDEQTTQWPKEKGQKRQTTIYKTFT